MKKITFLTLIALLAFSLSASIASARGPRQGHKLHRHCVQANPSVTVTPVSNTVVTAGEDIYYDVTVTNNDSARCGTNRFNTIPFASPTAYNYYPGTFFTPDLAPGETATGTMIIVTYDDVAPGNYSFVYRAGNANYPSFYTNSDYATYTVVE